MPIEIGKLEIKGIIRRRKKLFFIVSSLICFVCVVVAFVLPPLYTSQATIIVENQEIPEEYVRSSVTTFVSERLQVLENKILKYKKLVEISKGQALYPDFDTTGEMVAEMKKNIDLKTIDVALKEVATRNRATIAFTLSFSHSNPEKAKAVADILANLFVEEDRKARLRQAETTTMFLEKELEGLRQQVKLNEERISSFKAQNINQLPGSTGAFAQTLFRLEQNIDDIDSRRRTLQEKVIYLKSQIANIDPLVPILTEEGKVASNPANRLKYLRLQLIRMQSNLSDKHPDIIRLKSEIKELEAQHGSDDGSAKYGINQLSKVEKDIAELKAKFGDKHPDVIRLTKEADLLKQQISAAQQNRSIENEITDNPAYMNIKAQIIVAESEIDGLQEDRLKLSDKLEDYQKRLEMAPFVDEEYNSLTLDYENAKKKYNEVANKLHSARISQMMDTSESGQRFRVESPANLPVMPSEPNRLLIILMGFVLGIGCGITLAALFEGLDSSIKAAGELEALTGMPVLATFSFVESPIQKRLRRTRQLTVLSTVVVFILFGSLLLNWFVMPLGDIWDKFEDRLVEIGVPIEKDRTKL